MKQKVNTATKLRLPFPSNRVEPRRTPGLRMLFPACGLAYLFSSCVPTDCLGTLSCAMFLSSPTYSVSICDDAFRHRHDSPLSCRGHNEKCQLIASASRAGQRQVRPHNSSCSCSCPDFEWLVPYLHTRKNHFSPFSCALFSQSAPSTENLVGGGVANLTLKPAGGLESGRRRS